MKTLTTSQIDTFKIRKPVFVRAQELTGVPWQAVAAVWYRESFSVTPPKTPGGPFQFDPIPPAEVLKGLLMQFCSKTMTPAEMDLAVKAGVNDFRSGAVFAACWLRRKAKAIITPNATDEEIKDAFYGYNGRKYGRVDKSPYVMNFFDAAHCGPDGNGMVVHGTIPDGKGGVIWIHRANQQLGAFTVYKKLKELGI